MVTDSFKGMEMLGVKVCVFRYLLAVSFIYAAIAGPVTDPVEVKALRAIKGAFKDPMKHLQSWGKGDPCSSNWLGVWCFDSIGSDGYVHVHQLDLMWNNISGSIPKEIGNILSLELLLLNGNQFSGSLPDEIGRLTNLVRLQLDENQLSGVIPKSFANLTKLKHLHLNNNSLSGQIPPELSRLPNILHLLLDNNNLSGYLPPEFSETARLTILQLDNNRFDAAEIPASYGSPNLLKLSLRNCSLRGNIPDLSGSPVLYVVDLSWNQLTGSLPSSKLAGNMTTIDLSNNNLNGSIPANFSDLPNLQRLSLWNNSLSGSVPSTLWRNINFSSVTDRMLDLRNNLFSNTSGDINPPKHVMLRLQGNPVCGNKNKLKIVQFCGTDIKNKESLGSSDNSTVLCSMQSCPAEDFFEYVPESPIPCFCASPLRVGYRLKSPSISDFPPYRDLFEVYVTTALNLDLYQLKIDSFMWEEGPRLRMYLKLYPKFNNHSSIFNSSEIQRIRSILTMWTLARSNLFGPYELLNFTLLVALESSKPSISKGGLAGIVLGAAACALIISLVVAVLITKRQARYRRPAKKNQELSMPIHITGLKSFSFNEMALATSNFSDSAQIGRGGYGRVYKGILADKTVVAIKRAQEDSVQGQKEFFTEIELLSRLHHRNLVSLLGYCNEDEEQMLIYEFMPNGTLRDCLSGNSFVIFYQLILSLYFFFSKVAQAKEPLSFAMRLRIALGSAKGILYLHTEADPPIFHRDVKASNILLDPKYNAKVADFGLSRLAPVPDCDGVMPGHVSTIVKGTPGYLDPEYFLTRKLTDKSDVYSLGVVFLELLTGMHPIQHGKNIIREVNAAYQSGIYFAVIDNRMGCYHPQCVEKFMKLAFRCCQDETDSRPAMLEVVRELEHIWQLMLELESLQLDLTDIESDEVLDMMPPPRSIENLFSGEVITSSLSVSTIRHPNASTDVSGSELLSDVAPMIRPR
ncbi:hypothetical protein MKX01_002721 [Papaver californicum]|nr:hypothetical protein MKX01_002721 [Papaver californicum]